MALLVYAFLLYTWIIQYSVQGNAILDSTPGLTFHPTPTEEHPGSNLIWHNSTSGSLTYWTTKLDNFLAGYRTPGVIPGRGQNIVRCDYDQPPREGNVCDVDIRNWNPCTHENNYGYHRLSPCVFLKLNAASEWRPIPYNDTNALPENMPLDLKANIMSQKMHDPEHLNTVWVSCKGYNPADEENIGPIQYIPRRGFPAYYFSNMDMEGYLSPLVAIHFERPQRGIIINVECRAWAHNINYDRILEKGSVIFDLLLD